MLFFEPDPNAKTTLSDTLELGRHREITGYKSLGGVHLVSTRNQTNQGFNSPVSIPPFHIPSCPTMAFHTLFRSVIVRRVAWTHLYARPTHSLDSENNLLLGMEHGGVL